MSSQKPSPVEFYTSAIHGTVLVCRTCGALVPVAEKLTHSKRHGKEYEWEDLMSRLLEPLEP